MKQNRLDRSRIPDPGSLRPFRFPPIDRFQLSNGLPVLAARTESLPVVTYSLLLPAGAIHEAGRDAGLASLVGSLLESGTGSMDAAAIAERLETLGVRMHVGTSWEVSRVDFTALSAKAGEAAQVVATLVGDPTFPEGEVERIRHQQLASIMQRRAEPRGLANEMVARYVFSEDTPFSRPLVGTPRSVAQLSREKAMSFHADYFTPMGASLIVAGNLTSDEMRTTTEVAFGEWTGDAAVKLPTVVEARSDTTHVVIIERPGAVQSEIRIGHVGVPRNSPDYFPILVLNTVLGGAFSSRLNLNLREKHGFTYGANSRFVMRRRPGPFIVSAAVQSEVTGRAIEETLNELHRIREAEIRPDELADARQYVAGTFPLRLETTDGVASRLAELAIYDLPDSYLDDFAERVLAVTADEVLQAARQHIHPDRLAIVIVGDPDPLRPQLESLNLGPIEAVRPESNE
ncbi:MAG: hypothetical protein GEU90_02630 [Gemmatimonas sp.]|nr:hypothetical protein [Gemmatimonas sp.]